jgi:hypothetical protein
MDRIARLCEEVHAFDGRAERTGVTMELRALKSGKRRCTSVRDLVRKYKLYGDGLFYLPVGLWPRGKPDIDLDNVKWPSNSGASSDPNSAGDDAGEE